MSKKSIKGKTSISSPTLLFPKEEKLLPFVDSNSDNTKSKNDKILVLTSNSKVGTGLIQKEYTANSRLNTVIGRKVPIIHSSYIPRFKTIFNVPVETFGRKFSSALLLFLVLIIVINGFLVGFLIDIWTNTPSLEQFLKKPIQSSVLYARDGQTKIYEYYKEERREQVPIYRIPKVMQLAVIALEDENFYRSDQGIPWKNLAGSGYKCLTSGGEDCRGGSGLSQQLVKVMTNKKEATANRKIRELISALKLNQETNRVEILQAYLNWVPFGRNSYGIEQATKSYFGRSVSDKTNNNFTMSPVEACFLASMIQSPGYYPSGLGKTDSQAWLDLSKRKNACLEKLATLDLPIDDDGNIGKYIASAEDLNKLQSQQIELVENSKYEETRKDGKIAVLKQIPQDDPFPHFREYVTEELVKMYGYDTIYGGGLKIVTTLDPQLQKETQKIISDGESRLKAVGANNAGGLILDGSSGQILSMVGSFNYNRDDIDGKVNMTLAPRQPGSSIKPYVYANAWQNAYNPQTLLTDKPESWNGFSPKNFSGKFSGLVSMRYALQSSLNIPAVKTLLLSSSDQSISGYKSDSTSPLEKSLNSFFNFAERTGISFPCMPSDASKCKDPNESKTAYRSRCFLATALGGCEVSMIKHATGINTLLQEGNLRSAKPFLSITVKDEKEKDVEIFKPKENIFYPQQDKSIDPLVAKQVANVMTDYQARINEFGTDRFNLELLNKSWKVAAKTGTTNGPRDFWVVGGSPYYTVTIWAGRNDSKSMSTDASAGGNASFVWNKIMENLHKNKVVKNFSLEGLEKVEVRPGVEEYLTPTQKIFIKEKSGMVEPKFKE
jgi:membrane peptidoglycan carboxypeptidase